tara:strand:+ start:191 stop:1246 length:1056 start_codon:yes stop_codon:yes gene_type:complete
MIKAVSLFTSAGVGEAYLEKIGVNVVLANELQPKRCKMYKHLYPKSKMIEGDIRDYEIKKQILNSIKGDEKILIATPPCQGVSTLGKNKNQDSFNNDKRNYLIFDAIEIIDKNNFDFVLIENVARFKGMYFPYKGKFLNIYDIFKDKYSKHYVIKQDIINAKDFGIAQTRPRFILKMYKHGKEWPLPKEEKEITLRQAIGHLPTLEAGEDSGIYLHKAKEHNERDILAMRHTHEGKSALKNSIYYPKRKDGVAIKGFHNTYKRLEWDKPCHARTTNSGNVGSHNNVHPGRINDDGTVSDARVLTLHELFIVASLPIEWDVPEWATDNFIRTCIGESVPPLMMKKIFETLKE